MSLWPAAAVALLAWAAPAGGQEPLRPGAAYYAELRGRCRVEGKGSCCELSVNAMEGGGYALAPDRTRSDGGCPVGERPDGLRCVGGASWCIPDDDWRKWRKEAGLSVPRSTGPARVVETRWRGTGEKPVVLELPELAERPGDDYYVRLREKCKGVRHRACCLASAEGMERGGWRQARTLVSAGRACPAGLTPNKLDCVDSLRWCEPLPPGARDGKEAE